MFLLRYRVMRETHRILFVLALVAAVMLPGAPQPPAASSAASAAGPRALLDQYCVGCHNQKPKTAGLMLDNVDLTKVPSGAEMWEKVLVKVRSGMMPPAGMPKPGLAAIDGFATWIETQLDQAYFARVNPGRVGIHRLNRAEYGNAVRDLLGLDTAVASLISLR